MSVFSRLGTLLKSNINDLISRAENPEKILNQLIIDMREQLVEAKKQVAIAIADEKKVRRQLENELHMAAEWEKKAMAAVRANRDDLAGEALNRKQQHDNLSAEYRKQWEAQKLASDELRSSLRQLHLKIEEAQRKKDLLIARQRRVEAQTRIQETLKGFGDSSAFEAFDRMSKKIETMEAEAEATAELTNELKDGDLDAKFRSLEADASANEALAALKAKMGVARPAPAPVAAPVTEESVDEVDFEEMERELAQPAQARRASTPGSFSRDEF
jgi:phage shock protein A